MRNSNIMTIAAVFALSGCLHHGQTLSHGTAAPAKPSKAVGTVVHVDTHPIGPRTSGRISQDKLEADLREVLKKHTSGLYSMDYDLYDEGFEEFLFGTVKPAPGGVHQRGIRSQSFLKSATQTCANLGVPKVGRSLGPYYDEFCDAGAHPPGKLQFDRYRKTATGNISPRTIPQFPCHHPTVPQNAYVFCD